MSQRHFVPCTIRRSGLPEQRGFRIECSRCNQPIQVPVNEIANSNPRDQADKAGRIAERKFIAAGWFVGKRPQDDLCPAHAQGRATPAATAPAPRIGGVSIVPAAAPVMKEVVVSPSDIDPPSQMTRADGRIIFEKLNEVYGDEDKGYLEHWTDAEVARTLGCPRAWVANVREQHFGPAGSNAQLAQQLEEAKRIIAQAAEIVGKMNALGERLKIAEGSQRDIAAAVTMLRTQFEQARSELSSISTMVEKAGRSIASIERLVA